MSFITNSGLKTACFSKAGRISKERHGVSTKEGVLDEKQRKVFVVPSFSRVTTDPFDSANHNSIYPKDFLNKLPPKMYSPMSQQTEYKSYRLEKSNTYAEPFKLMLSREDRNQLQKNSRIMSQAIYKPKYDYVEKRKNIVNINMKKFSARISQFSPERESRSQSPPKDITKSLTSVIEPRIRGPIVFSKQSPRVDPMRAAEKLKKFDNEYYLLEWPENLSSNKRMPVHNMEKGLARKAHAHSSVSIASPIYNPKFEIVEKRFNKFDKLMSKVSGRKDSAPNINDIDTHYNLEEYQHKSNIFQKLSPKSPSFDKMLPREKDPNSKLPPFMQKNRTSTEPTPVLRPLPRVPPANILAFLEKY